MRATREAAKVARACLLEVGVSIVDEHAYMEGAGLGLKERQAQNMSNTHALKITTTLLGEKPSKTAWVDQAWRAASKKGINGIVEADFLHDIHIGGKEVARVTFAVNHKRLRKPTFTSRFSNPRFDIDSRGGDGPPRK